MPWMNPRSRAPRKSPRRALRRAALLMCAIAATGCAAARAPRDTGAVRPPAENGLPAASVTPLAADVWLHKSYAHIDGWGAVMSAGLIVRTTDGVFLVDTAWDDAQTEAVRTWVQAHLEAPIAGVIVTHAHEDKMGGLRALHAAGVPSYATAMTNADAPGRGLEPARHTLVLEHDEAHLAGGALTVFWPGAGHTRDNVVVYHAPSGVLFGGCLVRPGQSTSLGNTADGNVGHWAAAVRAVQARFPDARTVVPSHGPHGGPALLSHTIDLARAPR